MLRGFLILMCFLLLGESISFLLALPVNGGVVGMLLLTLWLMINGDVSADLVSASQKLISVLVFLIMPGVVGVFFLADEFTSQWLPVIVALLLGTLLSVLTTFLLMRSLGNDKTESRHHD
ncbi:CidA/LrgA family protein [Marinobacterium jannaschii]|uniref:CidA/LrgA family protein n=1 Tax=Marinobacterium jannaschii TaxID=64970 RepID=UPI0004862D36|nr:CidA/LrgA family protein [Marinobacterium jannaschii]